MKSESSRTLKDVCEFIVDCLHKTAPLQKDGYPSIRTPNVGRGRLLLEGVNRVSDETYQEWTRRAVPRANDLILAREAPAGNVAIIKNGQIVCLGQRTVHLRPDLSKVDPDFLCYYLLAPAQQGALLAGETGATAGHVNMRDIRRLRLLGLPALPVQRKAGAVLATYDDLITNNARRIELLERSARLLFEEWFVRLRYLGHEHDKIVDGVPEGWESSTVDGVCSEFVDGDWLESKDQGGDSFRILQISNIGENAFVETGNSRFITEETFRRLRCTEVRPGDIMISRMPEPIGRAWLVTEKPWRMVTAVDVTIARPNRSMVDVYYFLHHLNSRPHIARCKAEATGATRPRVAKRVMAALPILLPPHGLQRDFSLFASVINEMEDRLVRQNERLARARDLLLPRLMDGRIEV